MKKKKRPQVEVEKKVFTRYITARPDKTSDEDPDQTSDQISVDKRHYCTYCQRKRDESFMDKAGHGAFGKSKWRCIDNPKACLAIAALKKKARLTLVKG